MSNKIGVCNSNRCHIVCEKFHWNWRKFPYTLLWSFEFKPNNSFALSLNYSISLQHTDIPPRTHQPHIKLLPILYRTEVKGW